VQAADHEVEEIFRRLRSTAEVVLEDVILHDDISSRGEVEAAISSQILEDHRAYPSPLTPLGSTSAFVPVGTPAEAQPSVFMKPMYVIVGKLTHTWGGTPEPVEIDKSQATQRKILAQVTTDEAMQTVDF
jgi:hypothetical protein